MPKRSRGEEVAEQLMSAIDRATEPRVMRWRDAYDTLVELRESIDMRLEALRLDEPETKERD